MIAKIGGIFLTLVGAAALPMNVVLLPKHFAIHVNTEVVRPQALPLIVRAAGVVEPKRSLVFKAVFGGPILQKNFETGAVVTQGTLLLEIGRDLIAIQHQQRLNEFKNSTESLIRAKRNLKTQQGLYKREAVPLSDVDEAEGAVIRATQNVEAAKTALLLEQTKWNQDRIVAPFSGTILKDYVGQERDIEAGKEIAVLADITGYGITVRVDELDISQIRVGQKADVWVQAYGEDPLEGTVERVGPQAEGGSLPEIPVFIRLHPKSGPRLLPNLTAQARIHVGEISRALTVPLSALDTSKEIPRLWWIDAKNRLRSREVKLGRANPERVQILEGLVDQERICTTLDKRFINGVPVRFQ